MSADKKFYEAVFEGKYDTICGMMEGFLLGADREWDWFISKDTGIEAETFTEAFLEWASLRSKLHHVIIEEDFYNAITNACDRHKNMKFISNKYIKSAKIIKEASFEFEAKTYAKKYGLEIQEILRELPEHIKIIDFESDERTDKDAEGIELYAPEHHYEYKSTGTVTGQIKEIIDFREKLNEHPLVEVSRTKLLF